MKRHAAPHRLLLLALSWGLLPIAFTACAGSPWASESDPTQAETSCNRTHGFTDEAAAVVVEPLTAASWTVDHNEATFSSPRVADLNGDGVGDIVQGFGQDTLGAKESSVIATDGATGTRLWKSSGHDDLIGSAQFAHLGGDSTIDVAIGGRRGALIAVDGATGSLLWTFDNENGLWFNFYTPQIIADSDGDEVVDLLAANGGLVFEEPSEQVGLQGPATRNLGTTFAVSGATGEVIGSAPVPDRGEMYMSPLVVDNRWAGDGEVQGPFVLLGTGGETLSGGLWQVPLLSLIDGTTDGATELLDGGAKGIIAAPSLGHFTDDCALDVVVQTFDGAVVLLDGASGEVVWRQANTGYESYSSPAIGFFVGDDAVPDVFASVALGTWPEYESSDYMLINGASGEVVWRETLGTFAPSGFVAADTNGDGRDEAIFGVNSLAGNSHEILLLDTARAELHSLVTLDQTTFAAPWIGDLDTDGLLDLVVTESAYQFKDADGENQAIVRRYATPWDGVRSPSWGGYLGTDGTGRFTWSR